MADALGLCEPGCGRCRIDWRKPLDDLIEVTLKAITFCRVAGLLGVEQ